MTLTATPIYAGLLALLFVILSIRVIRTRFQARVSVGDGGDKRVIKAMRAHANCAEYVPLGLVLLALVELQGAPVWAVHVLGLMLLLGRLAHAYGFGRTPQIIPLRQGGMLLTFGMIALAGIGLLGHSLI